MSETKKCKYCQTEIDKKAKVCPNCTKKQGGKIKFIVIGVIIIFILIGAFGNDDSSDTNSKKATETTNKDVNTDDKAKSKAETTEAYEVELSAGNYTAGIDFPSGKYTLTATSGSGNVSTTNMYDGGLNEIMGLEDDGMNLQTFNNAKLESGVTLTIAGDLVLKINSDSANTSEMQQRENTLTKTVKLSSGNYVAGDDFPAGVYDIVATDGYGNVSSSNSIDGGINEVMGTEVDDMVIKEFKNANLDEGVELTISDVSIELVPSTSK